MRIVGYDNNQPDQPDKVPVIAVIFDDAGNEYRSMRLLFWYDDDINASPPTETDDILDLFA